MKPLIKYFNTMGRKTLACCCGHNRYPMTIVVESAWDKSPIEILSKTFLSKQKRYYMKDKKGFYFIPEVSKEKK